MIRPEVSWRCDISMKVSMLDLGLLKFLKYETFQHPLFFFPSSNCMKDSSPNSMQGCNLWIKVEKILSDPIHLLKGQPQILLWVIPYTTFPQHLSLGINFLWSYPSELNQIQIMWLFWPKINFHSKILAFKGQEGQERPSNFFQPNSAEQNCIAKSFIFKNMHFLFL